MTRRLIFAVALLPFLLQAQTVEAPADPPPLAMTLPAFIPVELGHVTLMLVPADREITCKPMEAPGAYYCGTLLLTAGALITDERMALAKASIPARALP